MSDKDTTAVNLRTLADCIEALPADVPTPTHIEWAPYLEWPQIRWLLFGAEDYAEQKVAAATIVRTLGGHWDKRETGNLFRFQRLTDGVEFEVVVNRSAVCELVVTGVETVTDKVPDPVALAQVPTITVTREVEQTEWHCQPLLAEAVSR